MNAWLRGIPSLVDTAEAELVVEVLQRAAVQHAETDCLLKCNVQRRFQRVGLLQCAVVQFCRERVSTEMPVLDGEEGRTVRMCLAQDALPVCEFFVDAQASGPGMAVPRDLLCGGVKDGCLLDGGTYKLP